MIKEESFEGCVRFLSYLIDYILDYKPKIEHGQTMSYYSWIVKFEKIDSYFTVWEVKSDGDGFVEGINYAISIINEQEELCDKFGVKPIYPQFDQKIVISKGVYEGLSIDASSIFLT